MAMEIKMPAKTQSVLLAAIEGQTEHKKYPKKEEHGA
jgi:hypothetical protein